MATDNAVSALGKIVEGPYADCTGMDANSVAGIWLAALPLTADHAEAQVWICITLRRNLTSPSMNPLRPLAPLNTLLLLQVQHELLVKLLEARDVRVLGQVGRAFCSTKD